MKKKKPATLVKLRHRFFTWFANWFIFRPFWRPFIHYRPALSHVEARKLIKGGPYLIVSNHVTALDPVLLTATLRTPVYFVASEVIFSMGFVSKLLQHTFSPIPKSKSMPDISTVVSMLKISKEGGNVGVFVEGNVSYTGGLAAMPESIGKIVKMMKRPLLIFNFHYLYLSSPRWAAKRRRGQAYGAVKRIIAPEEYENLQIEEINQLIFKEIDANVYHEPPRAFKTRHMAEHLHRLVFMCPKCGSVGSMHGHDDLVCSHCGFHAVFDQYGYLTSPEFGKQTLIEVDKKMKLDYEKFLTKNPNYILKLSGRLVMILKKTRKRPGQCDLALDESGLTFTMTNRKQRGNSEHFDLEQVMAFAIQGKRRFLFYIRGQYTRMVEFDDDISPYQVLLTMQILKQRDNFKKGVTSYELVSNDPRQYLGL